MCVNSEKRKCCCCLNLTHATLIIGGLFAVLAILTAIVGAWLSFTFYLLLTGGFSVVLFMPKNVRVRKILYYTSLALAALGAVAYLITVIYIFASDWEKDWCGSARNFYEYSDYYDNYWDCLDWINMIMIVVVLLVALIAIPCTL